MGRAIWRFYHPDWLDGALDPLRTLASIALMPVVLVFANALFVWFGE